jgi:predicted dehydrogenase
VDRGDIDAVLVLTPPDTHAEITIAAMESGKHVLCEKPLSRTISEAKKMVKTADDNKVILKCGFNHRHHPAISEAKKILDSGELGKPLFARCNYGICGRPEYENEWRADPKHAAGGQFIEQGIHAIDLFRWFLGEIIEVTGMTGIQYFKNQGVRICIEFGPGGVLSGLCRRIDSSIKLHQVQIQYKFLHLDF